MCEGELHKAHKTNTSVYKGHLMGEMWVQAIDSG